MFGLLKKKITGFIDNLTKKEESKGEAEKPKSESPEKESGIKIEPELKKEPDSKKKEQAKAEKPKAPEKKIEQPKKEKKPSKLKEEPEEKQESKKPAIETGPAHIEKKPITEKKIVAPKKEDKPIIKEVKEEPAPIEEVPTNKSEDNQIATEEELTLEPQPIVERVAEKKEEKPKERIKLSPFSVIKSFVTSEVEISENDVSEMLENLELELLEGDVEMDVASSITAELKEKLIGQKIKKKELHGFIKKAIKETLTDVMEVDGAFDLLSVMKSSEKPVKIMFLGVNGSGKTTTIAKMMNLLQTNGYKVVVAAADTFRAAAIEQMGVHADRLGVKMIKRDYGSDPTSVAYDAVNYAKAHGIDAVFIDTAGRQDTNVNLINELKKMNRVIEPDLKIYVGESIAGNAILEQLGTFHREIGVSGVILTKLDCDPKGGTMLSISRSTGVPIVYIGTGQKYEDIERFDALEMADRIVGES